MTAEKLMVLIDDYVERKIRSVAVQLNLVHVTELRKQAIFEYEDDAKNELEKALYEVLGK